MSKSLLPADPQVRKNMPMARGLLDYFPAALAAVANVSHVGNEKHNPGEELHWARGKSMDQADCIIRHLAERGRFDEVRLPDGRVFHVRHSAYAAWRALAMLQLELEEAGEAGEAITPLPPPERANEFVSTGFVAFGSGSSSATDRDRRDGSTGFAGLGGGAGRGGSGAKEEFRSVPRDVYSG